MGIEEVLASPITWIVIAAASEVIALSPMRDNSLVQLVLHALRALKTKKG
jgi:flagellar biosynthesis/type III secretory pathway protein FliH